MSVKRSDKILWTREEIMTFLGISKSVFYKLAKEKGFPGVHRFGRWSAHKDELNDFFRNYSYNRST